MVRKSVLWSHKILISWFCALPCSVARERNFSPNYHSTKMHNKKSITFFAFLRQSLAVIWTLKPLLKHLFGASNFSQKLSKQISQQLRPGARTAWLRGRGRNKFWGAREVSLCEFEGARGHEKFIRVWIKRKRWRPTKKKVFSSKISTNSSCRLKILAMFHEFLSKDQKKSSSSQNFYEIQCVSTKITKIRAVNTNLGVFLGLNLHSNSPEPVNFFGAPSSLGEAQAVIWGGTAPECPLVAPGLQQLNTSTKWLKISN